MDINELRSIVTVLSLLVFAGLAAWSWWPANRANFDAAAQIPFADEEPRS